MQRYNWTRPHQHNGFVPPAVAEEKLNFVSGNYTQYDLETYSQNLKPFRWHKKAEDILASVARAARALGK